MKIKISKKFVEIFSVTLLGTIIILWEKFFVCQLSVGLGFDQQAFLYWDYAKSLNLIPFRDFFYPYGLLFFFKIDSLFWNLVSLAIIFSISFSVFKIFEGIFKKRIFTYLFFFIFCLFSSYFFDFDTLMRYGLAIPFVYLFSKLTYEKIFFKDILGLILGLIIGLLFSFVSDGFIYVVIVFAFFYSYNLIFNLKKINLKLFKYSFFVICGFIIGTLPLIFFLYQNNAFPGFIENYKLIKEVSFFAKVPFPPTLKSFENMMNIVLIIFGLIYIAKKREKTFSYCLVVALVVFMVLFEQKNIIRANYQQISSLGFLLFLVLFAQIVEFFEKKKLGEKTIIIYSIFVLLLIFSILRFERNPVNDLNASIINGKRCVENKMNLIREKEIEKYMHAVNYLKNKNAKVFSYPGDPIFYILLNQSIPPYQSVYESSPNFAQEKQINYIKENNVNYVILNKNISSIQDGVPDKVRNKLLYKYIKNNFKIEKEIDNFLILKRK